MIKACIEDCKAKRAKGVTVRATVWEHMPKGFFRKYGFVDTDEKANISRMILKPKDIPDSRFPPQKNLYRPHLEKGKIGIGLNLGRSLAIQRLAVWKYTV